MKPMKLVRSFSILLSGPKMRLSILFGLLLSGAVLGVQTEAHSSNKFALVIGISNYEITSSNLVTTLEFADEDADAVGSLLVQELGYDKENVKVLKNYDGTRENILRAYYKLKERMNSDSEFILYFAGHGIRDIKVQAGEPRESYWMTYKTNFSEIEMEGIRLEDVYRLVKKLPAKRKLIILDHCYAGDLILKSGSQTQPQPVENSGSRNIPLDRYSSQTWREISPDPYKNPLERASINETVWTLPGKHQTMAIIAASRDLAYEHKLLGHGLLTWAIVHALTKDATKVDAFNKDDTITLQELVSYLTVTTEKMKNQLQQDNVEGIGRQQISCKIIQENAEILGWKLLNIPVSAEMNLLSDFLEDLYKKGLDTLTFNLFNDQLKVAKEQIKITGEIATDNCMGKEIFSLLNNYKEKVYEVGAVKSDYIKTVGNSLYQDFNNSK
jgi:hypothetical protein